MTDLLAVIDDGLGKFMKNRISLSYERHFEKSRENTRKWSNGEYSAMDIRVFLRSGSVMRWMN